MQNLLGEKEQIEINHPLGKVNAGNGHASFADLLDDYEFPRPQRGDIINGEVLRIADDVLFIDIGSKRDAIVPFHEVEHLAIIDDLTRGDTVPVYITRTPVGDEELIVSLERGLQILDWQRAEELLASEEAIELPVTRFNKGGLLVQFGRLEGFVPDSHVPALRQIYNREARLQSKSQYVGRSLLLKIIEVEQKRRRLVFSATAAQQEARRRRLESLEAGQKVTGTVVHMKPYGAFVELGDGVTGLLHVSRIAWQHINHPSEALDNGMEVELLIEDVDVAQERVSLDRKTLLPNPWEEFALEHQIGDLIEGEVSSVVDYGAFVQMPNGIEGLLHQKELHSAVEGTPQEILHDGDKILVRILDIDLDRQRLGLSMRRVSASEEIDWISQRQLDTV